MHYPMQPNFQMMPGPFLQQSIGDSSNFTAASSMNLPVMMMPVQKGQRPDSDSSSQEQQTSHSPDNGK